MGIRMYYALDEEQNRHLVLVGVDKNSNDMLKGATVADGEEDVLSEEQFATTERRSEPLASFMVGNDGRPCPPYSSEQNVLNS